MKHGKRGACQARSIRARFGLNPSTITRLRAYWSGACTLLLAGCSSRPSSADGGGAAEPPSSAAAAVCDGTVFVAGACPTGGAAGEPAVASVAPSPVPATPGPVPTSFDPPLPDVPVPALCSPASTVVQHSIAPGTQSEIDALGGCERIEGSLDLRILPQGAKLDALASLTQISGTLFANASYFADPLLPALEGVGAVHLSGVYAADLASLPRLQRVGLGAGADDGVVHIEQSTLASLAGIGGWGPLRRLEISRVDGAWQLSDLGSTQIEELELQDVSLARLALSAVHGLRALDVERDPNLTDITGWSDGSTLEILHLEGLPTLYSLGGLPPLPNLRHLELGDLGGLTSLEGLRLPAALDSLHLTALGTPNVPFDVSAIARTSSITSLTLNAMSAPLSAFALRQVTELVLFNYPHPDLHGLEAVSGIESLSVSPTGPLRLDGFADSSALRALSVKNVTTLAPIVLPSRMQTLSLDAGFADSGSCAPLRQVEHLYVSNTALADFSGFSQLQTAGEIFVTDNANLADISALSGLTSLGTLRMLRNDALVQMPAFPQLVTLGEFELSDHPQVAQGPAFPALKSASSITVDRNPLLQGVGGLAALQSVGKLDVEDNAVLVHMGVPASVRVGTGLRVLNNPLLDDAEFNALAGAAGPNIKVMRQVTPLRPCPWPNDGLCDEPDLCAPGSDLDCRLLIGDPVTGSSPRTAQGEATVPRTGVPAGAQLLSPSVFTEFCRRAAELDSYLNEPAPCAPLAEVLAQPDCSFVTQGCGLTRIESLDATYQMARIRWYADGNDEPVGVSGPELGLAAATQPIGCDSVDASCNTCGLGEPFCTNLAFPAANHPAFATIAVDPTTATSACSCEAQADGSSRVSSDCFCALFGCPKLDELQARCSAAPTEPVLLEQPICNHLEIQLGQGSGKRYAFDAQTGALVGAEAFGPNAGVLPCEGTRLVMGEAILGSDFVAPSEAGLGPALAQLPAGCQVSQTCWCDSNHGRPCLRSGAP